MWYYGYLVNAGIRYSNNFSGASRYLCRAINGKAVEFDTFLSSYPDRKETIVSDGLVHLTAGFERYLKWKSYTYLPKNTDLTFGQIEGIKTFYATDRFFTTSKLTKAERESRIAEYEAIRQQKLQPAKDRAAAKAAAKRREEAEKRSHCDKYEYYLRTSMDRILDAYTESLSCDIY